ncbi:1-deoxy-D-xylulose 5-phosphate reductoisomerase [Desulfonatronum thiosulfatophilum]|uniref:1-deoxy-D-xylulose 5-phosphate reductoisomerase n=1 Tax=Desulfonatronum thiosulfatophilum TaxID=617002 RepID=A0A1G6C7J4_9BACT|nr:1-deoxy-D-xylulose-5-phosphate reductoisomerase [Desulfonatronum thiosulfatophilum]SDB28778.1 1-deoxy-D-xylulose 5-phosphate reductoisomerase [Desulfonatronum thiosulfatophilum]
MPMPNGFNYISAVPGSGSSIAADNPRRLVILGSTGSIGQSALGVIREHPERFRMLGLAGGRNIRLLAEQARQWRPGMLAVLDASLARELAELLPPDYSPEIVHGKEGYESLATLPEAELVISAQVGAAGLPATLAAARAGKVIALANKESLVLAGNMIREACRQSGAMILPVDSEHNAVFQSLRGEKSSSLKQIILTASGGPFRDLDAADLAGVTVRQALAHPNWSMGAKISVDSATLMNKGLEVIEACLLFGVELERVAVLIHPQSIVHSLVEFEDRSLLAHMGPADMRVPISYCLGFPDRLGLQSLAPLDLLQAATLSFSAPRSTLFPCLDLARQAFASGPSHLVVLNAANETAVDLFLKEKLSFMNIPALIRHCLDEHPGEPMDSLESILDLSARTQSRAQNWAVR